MASLKEQYVDKGQEVIEKGQAIERAIVAKERYESRIEDATTEYNACIDELEAIVGQDWRGPSRAPGEGSGRFSALRRSTGGREGKEPDSHSGSPLRSF